MALVPAYDVSSHMTVDEYLARERQAPERQEYLDGFVYAMADESPNHGTICMNLCGSLWPQLRGTSCRGFTKDMKVRCGPLPRPGRSRQGLYAYPDLVIVCGAMQFHDQEQDVLINPKVIIEVLSASTEAFDRGEKFRRYRAWLPTLTDYVLVAQDQAAIDYYSRVTDDCWQLRSYDRIEARLQLEAVGCVLPVEEIYERIEFPAAATEDAS
jgi:Uma2 family endonuclease